MSPVGDVIILFSVRPSALSVSNQELFTWFSGVVDSSMRARSTTYLWHLGSTWESGFG